MENIEWGKLMSTWKTPEIIIAVHDFSKDVNLKYQMYGLVKTN